MSAANFEYVLPLDPHPKNTNFIMLLKDYAFCNDWQYRNYEKWNFFLLFKKPICAHATFVTFASKITVTRLLMAPVFAVLSVYYAQSVKEGHAIESLRYAALIVFIIASASDALDGFIARHFNQRSAFGAFIDPIADKTLLLTGIITLSLIDWGSVGWRIPLWFTALVIVRDAIILGGICILWGCKVKVEIRPHWSGKISTFAQMFALGWVMLRWVSFSPIYPCLFAGIFTAWSGVAYFLQGLRLLKTADLHHPHSAE